MFSLLELIFNALMEIPIVACAVLGVFAAAVAGTFFGAWGAVPAGIGGFVLSYGLYRSIGRRKA
ncbi:hypothetical protein E8L99_21390 [Phreatobacter aquaticus]|uniref:Uncharacterized protein n=1 Tax=Phreatobacter aquaticus TaxID=2570229 RepID=A0A4D7QKJ4_9HYPH|nr:hypothetical protein [Phreatobacter aquaticus]QCK88128.1 hypothetical protein E8L99_21390 [Phreatobacter aquaticus]